MAAILISLLLGQANALLQISVAQAAVAAQKQNFQLPVNTTIDEPTESQSPGDSLAPVKLEPATVEFQSKGPAGEEAGVSSEAPAPAKGGVKEKAKSKGPDFEAATGTGSRKGGKVPLSNESLIDAARKTNSMPIPLIHSQAELMQRSDQIDVLEQKQISQLWEAALQRSPDIQFVVQKLVPNSNPQHTSTVLMRLMTTALYAGAGAAGTIAPGQSSLLMQNGTAGLLNSLSGAIDSKNAKSANLDQTQLIILYQMVRGIADTLVDHYRDYKLNIIALKQAAADFEDLKAMAAESTARPLETEYTLRKQKRDIGMLANYVHRYRQNLIDLAGPEAVEKLDQEIGKELETLGETSAVEDNKK